ncbi:MAG: SiaB family protein kinase [Defluviitaleaceae bacterium]|nr:SiaB family protein kinase [Defluviitaleaceae bacterium]MCL2239798.1 SiaB family protein kinase [Defluviitaleaceae bacterium]
MILDMNEYVKVLQKFKIDIVYSGPMWEDGIKGLAEMVKVHLKGDDIPGSSARAVFSVFVEQVTNMLMYSAQKERFPGTNREPVDVSAGIFVLGYRGKTYFIQTRNAVKNESVDFIKGKIDHLNTLDKKELRQLHRESVRGENDNPESKGAGLGLIEIARRASKPISYAFEPAGEGKTFFTMCVEIGQEEK